MTRLVAFLRGINLVNRHLTMDALRGHLEGMGLEGLATYLASGNVVFATGIRAGRRRWTGWRGRTTAR